MRFTATASAVMAFAASALAQTEGFNPINTPAKDAVLPAGSTFEVTWDVPDEYRDDSVSISLIGGDNPKTLVPVTDIAGKLISWRDSTCALQCGSLANAEQQRALTMVSALSSGSSMSPLVMLPPTVLSSSLRRTPRSCSTPSPSTSRTARTTTRTAASPPRL